MTIIGQPYWSFVYLNTTSFALCAIFYLNCNYNISVHCLVSGFKTEIFMLHILLNWLLRLKIQTLPRQSHRVYKSPNHQIKSWYFPRNSTQHSIFASCHVHYRLITVIFTNYSLHIIPCQQISRLKYGNWSFINWNLALLRSNNAEWRWDVLLQNIVNEL